MKVRWRATLLETAMFLFDQRRWTALNRIMRAYSRDFPRRKFVDLVNGTHGASQLLDSMQDWIALKKLRPSFAVLLAKMMTKDEKLHSILESNMQQERYHHLIILVYLISGRFGVPIPPLSIQKTIIRAVQKKEDLVRGDKEKIIQLQDQWKLGQRLDAVEDFDIASWMLKTLDENLKLKLAWDYAGPIIGHISSLREKYETSDVESIVLATAVHLDKWDAVYNLLLQYRDTDMLLDERVRLIFSRAFEVLKQYGYLDDYERLYYVARSLKLELSDIDSPKRFPSSEIEQISGLCESNQRKLAYDFLVKQKKVSSDPSLYEMALSSCIEQDNLNAAISLAYYLTFFNKELPESFKFIFQELLVLKRFQSAIDVLRSQTRILNTHKSYFEPVLRKALHSFNEVKGHNTFSPQLCDIMASIYDLTCEKDMHLIKQAIDYRVFVINDYQTSCQLFKRLLSTYPISNIPNEVLLNGIIALSKCGEHSQVLRLVSEVENHLEQSPNIIYAVVRALFFQKEFDLARQIILNYMELEVLDEVVSNELNAISLAIAVIRPDLWELESFSENILSKINEETIYKAFEFCNSDVLLIARLWCFFKKLGFQPVIPDIFCSNRPNLDSKQFWIRWRALRVVQNRDALSELSYRYLISLDFNHSFSHLKNSDLIELHYFGIYSALNKKQPKLALFFLDRLLLRVSPFAKITLKIEDIGKYAHLFLRAGFIAEALGVWKEHSKVLSTLPNFEEEFISVARASCRVHGNKKMLNFFSSEILRMQLDPGNSAQAVYEQAILHRASERNDFGMYSLWKAIKLGNVAVKPSLQALIWIAMSLSRLKKNKELVFIWENYPDVVHELSLDQGGRARIQSWSKFLKVLGHAFIHERKYEHLSLLISLIEKASYENKVYQDRDLLLFRVVDFAADRDWTSVDDIISNLSYQLKNSGFLSQVLSAIRDDEELANALKSRWDEKGLQYLIQVKTKTN